MSIIKRFISIGTLAVILLTLTSFSTVFAQPYGRGIYGDDLPYGSETSLSINTNGNVFIPATPDTNGTLATSTSVVTVSSTDVAGYKLYVRALESTDLTNVTDTLPASSNLLPAPLQVNTWGYNTNGSSNFIGISLDNILIRSTGPLAAGAIQSLINGENTEVTYGLNIDLSKPAGNYDTSVIYTAVPQTN